MAAERAVTVAANLKRVERLGQAILKRAFEGRLAAQDPNDDLVSALRHRVRACRAADTTAKP